jgi:phospholipid transport system substrate-binding protein
MTGTTIGVTRRGVMLMAVAAMASARHAGAQASAGALAQPLQALYAGLEAVMRAGLTTPFPRRFDILAPVVDRVFDLKTVLKVSVGLRWDSMEPATQARLLRVYRRFTVATYVANFNKYDGEQFQILPGVRDAGSDRIVGTAIITDGNRMRLDYVMRDGSGVWRAVDVLLDGSISRVAVQRSDFRKILANGDTEALIASLRRKITDLADGALSS